LVIELSEDFWDMSRDNQIFYLTENLRTLPDDLVDPGIEILKGAGEIEYAIALAKDTGRNEKAIEIAIDEGDYLWAALIASKAGMKEESKRLYREGLDYYVSMDMYGRAVSAAKALGLPQNEIDLLFEAGIRSESRNLNMGRIQATLDSLALSLEGVLAEKDDEITKELKVAMKEEMERIERRNYED